MPSSPPADLAIPEIVPPGKLAGVREEWSALWRSSPRATPFQAPEWLLPWSHHFAPGRTGAVALRRKGMLVALLPVFCWQGAMLIAGTGPSDRADILVRPGCEPALPALLAALPQLHCDAWTRLDLRQLPGDSPLLRAEAPSGWTDTRLLDEACHVAPLRGPDGLGAVSRRRRANWRYALRRIEREGGTIGRVPEHETPQAMDDLIRLHNLRWSARGEPGIFADPLLSGFLREAGPVLAASGLLRLHELRFGTERAALLMVLAGRAAHHYFIGGFDPAHERLSPSAALVGAAMGHAHREGAAEFDFLRGAEPYKRHWGAEPRNTHRRLLQPAA